MRSLRLHDGIASPSSLAINVVYPGLYLPAKNLPGGCQKLLEARRKSCQFTLKRLTFNTCHNTRTVPRLMNMSFPCRLIKDIKGDSPLMRWCSMLPCQAPADLQVKYDELVQSGVLFCRLQSSKFQAEMLICFIRLCASSSFVRDSVCAGHVVSLEPWTGLKFLKGDPWL